MTVDRAISRMVGGFVLLVIVLPLSGCIGGFELARLL